MDDRRAKWEADASDEILFWKSFLTNPDMCGEYMESRFQPVRWVQGKVMDAIPPSYDAESCLRLLEVGAGPAPILGNRHREKSVELIAVDPLADKYNKLLEELSITPPVSVRKLFGEELESEFEEESFHYAYANNCLDHAIDPMRCILGMFKLIKPGCCVDLRHKRNEAVTQDSAGLHQWNFDLVDNRLVLWSPHFRAVLEEILSGCAELSHAVDGIWIESRIRKTGSLE